MNRYLLVLLAIACFTSCTETSSENSEVNDFSISMDTVQIDSKGEILFLNYFLNISTLDPSQEFLYNLNVRENILEKINMETLSLDSLIQLEKEGPNGIGDFPNTIMAFEDGGFLFSNSYTLNYFDALGNKTKQITLSREPFIQDLLPPGKSINIQSSGISADGRFLTGLYGEEEMMQMPEGIIHIDLENEKGEIIPTTAFEFITESNILFQQDGRPAGANSGLIFFESAEDKLVLSSNSRNNIMIYDLLQDSLLIKSFESKYTSDEQKSVETVTVEDLNEFLRLRKEKEKDVTFGPWELDQKTGNRWRFSKELDRVIGEDSLIFKTVVTAIDKNFELLGEAQLPEEFVFPYSFRILNGMPYVFLNIEDELAFIRLKPSFDDD